jgi:hypothetical protein
VSDFPKDRLADYVQVNERILAFTEKYPDGCLQSEIVEVTDSRIVMRAYAYRTPEDTKPGIGHSWLEIPGRTPYTRGSEIENCETSAWGRALAALGFEVKRGIATAEDVANKSAPSGSAPPGVEREGAPTALPSAGEMTGDEFLTRAKEHFIPSRSIEAKHKALKLPDHEQMTPKDWWRLAEALEILS